MNAGRLLGAIVLAAVVSLILVYETRPKPPREILPWCYWPQFEVSAPCKRVQSIGRA
jgi:hypothetical protein